MTGAPQTDAGIVLRLVADLALSMPQARALLALYRDGTQPRPSTAGVLVRRGLVRRTTLGGVFIAPAAWRAVNEAIRQNSDTPA